MTVLSAPASAGSTASTSLSQPYQTQHPLKEQRRRLQETQSQIIQIDRIKAQLEQLQAKRGRGNTRRLSSSSDVSSWSVASTSSRSSVASDIKGRELLVPLSGIAFVSATISEGGGKVYDDDDVPNIYMRKDFNEETVDNGLNRLVPLDEVTSSKDKADYEEMTIPSAIAALDEQRQILDESLANLRDEVVSAARATLIEHLGGQPESSEDATAPVNEQGQALNEEGLPFVDPMEPLPEGQERNGVSALAPHVREEAMTKEARQKWMDSLLSKLEDEEVTEEDVGTESRADVALTSRKRPEAHRRLSSAERPAPPKSVLKQTGPLPLPIPKFGSSGFRRGFLNLNPSSPAAEHSSDPVEAFDFSKGEATRTNSSMDDDFRTLATGSSDDRMSRSMELPKKKATHQKRKKTVRILSPERERKVEQKAPVVKSPKGKSVRDAEDDGQEEAASILELLGLDAIKDHPQAADLYEALKDSEKMEQLAKKVDAARIAALKKEAGQVKKPAVSQTVTERPINDARATSKEPSAFKKGFLNEQPAASTSAVPVGPSISQGVSAGDRATQSDVDLEKEREEKGLKPTVPHARPSKAFAEKMEAKRRGEAVKRESEEEKPAKMSKVRFGDEGKGDEEEKTLPGDDEEDDYLDSIGMHISEEHLDEDTVEALGYFSDEEYDPDIGLNEEDILMSKPQFSADASQITNEELRKEYERIKASLGSSNHTNGGIESDDDDIDDFLEGRDLSLQNGEENTTKVSRFKQDRAKRALNGQSAVSNELGTGLEKAQNIGPSMLIPSIANIRYPIHGQSAVEGQEVQLQGQGDEEDDDLEDLMRQRLIQRDQANANGSVRKSGEALAPPQVISVRNQAQSQSGEAEQAPAPPPIKRSSLFKSRMSQK